MKKRGRPVQVKVANDADDEIEPVVDGSPLSPVNVYADPMMLRRDLRNLIPLELLQKLDAKALDIVALFLMGLSQTDTAKRLGCSVSTVSAVLDSAPVQEAIRASSVAIRTGLLTASDVAQACEAEVMKYFYLLTMQADTPLEWKYKFGSRLLDHRLQILKALPLPIAAQASRNALADIMDIPAHVKERMAIHVEMTKSRSLPPGQELADLIDGDEDAESLVLPLLAQREAV